MDFRYTEAEQAFKDQFETWLSSHAPEGFGTPGYESPGTWDKMAGEYRRFQGALFDAGYAGLNALIQALFIVVSAVFISIVGSLWLSKKMFTSQMFGHLALQSVQDSEQGFTSSDIQYQSMIGQEGIAQTMLRPAGKVIINDQYYDATAITGYIEKGEKITVVKYETAQLFVKKQDEYEIKD